MRRVFGWLLVGCSVLAGVSSLKAGEVPPVVRLDDAKAPLLNAAENSTITPADCDGAPGLRWQVAAGQSGTLSLRSDAPLLQQLCLYDRFEFEFRIASGAVNTLDLKAMGHVSGARRYKVHQWTAAVATTERGVWHKRSFDLSRPNWFPWDNPDGEGAEPYLLFETLALEPGTVVEMRGVRLTRPKLLLKPDYELPVTWPVKSELPDGSTVYTLTLQVLNVSGRPLEAAASIVSKNSRFTIEHDGKPQELKSGKTAAFTLKATMSAEDRKQTPELYEESLEVRIAPTDDPDAACRWAGVLVRPFSDGLKRQVIFDEKTLQTVRQRVAEGGEDIAKALELPRVRKVADEFCGRKLLMLPRGHAHVRNNFPSFPGTNPAVVAQPGEFMPEVVSRDGKFREVGTDFAGHVWKEYLAISGNVYESLGNAYLYTGEEKYALKAVELLRLFARQYAELEWNSPFDAPWNRGTPNLAASRIALSSSYGSNWYLKNFCRLTSCIADSPAFTPEIRAEVYRGFVLPYATELMKFPGGISNMTDVTNHNILLLGIVFDDANMVRWALLSDPGLLRRLSDIDEDGFSSEGRPLNYHFAAMSEYLPSIGYLENMGVKVKYPKERLLAAMRMPFRRATLTGHVPSSGDCGRWNSTGLNRLADALIPIFPEESWLWPVGATPLRRLIATTPPADGAGWKALLQTEPHLFRTAGLAVMRQGQTAQEQIQLTFDYGRNLFHAALDRNQIALSAFGRVFTHGPGSLYNVGSGGMTRGEDKRLDSFCSHGSLGHNVLIVDELDQLPAVGILLAWSADPTEQFVASRVEGIRPGVNHTRAVALINGVGIIFDLVESEEEHTYDLAYHNFGTFQEGKGWASQPLQKPIAKTANYENIVNPAVASGTGLFRANWTLEDLPAMGKGVKPNASPAGEAGAIRLEYWQTASVPGTIYLGTTGMNNPDTKKIPDTAPSVFYRCKGKTVRYTTVLEPCRGESRIGDVRFEGETVAVKFLDGTEVRLSLPELLKKYAVR